MSTLTVTNVLEINFGCPDCANQIQQTIAALPGVKSAVVNYGAGKLQVIHDPQKTSLQKITQTLAKMGHSATIEGNNNLQFVTGLLEVQFSCPDCAEQIKKVIEAMSGVQSVEINYGAGKVRIIHNPEETSLQRIAQTIIQMGHQVKVKSTSKPSVRNAWWKQTRIVLLGIAAILTILSIIMETAHIGLPENLFKFLYGFSAFIGGIYPARAGWMALKRRQITINTLLIVGALGAIYLGLWEEGAGLVIIFSLGEVLEAYAVDKARGSLQALVKLAPKEATVIRDGKEIRTSIEQLQINDIVLIRPGEKIAADGIVIEGKSAVDQSPITGESIPVEKELGSKVYASTLNGRGALKIKVTKLAQDTTLAKIIHLVEEAQTKKSAAQRFSERFGQIYTPVMFVLAILMVSIPSLVFNQPFNSWLYRGLVILVVSCSCSLVLSIPVAIIAGVGNAARHGVLVKGGIYMENAGRVQVIAFDKTGTLTKGKPTVTDIITMGENKEEEILKIAGSLEVKSEHPLAEAILNAMSQYDINPVPVHDFITITGRGARGVIDGKAYYIGNPSLFEENGILLNNLKTKIVALQNEGNTVMLVGDSGSILGLIAAADQPKENAKQAIEKLKILGIKKIVMLTGDNQITGEAIGRQLGVDEVKSELLPEDKIAAIRTLQEQYGLVAMVGDGVNDAPALAQADIGIAMGVTGSDVALETADIALMADDLNQLVYMIEISRKTVKTIKQNITFSLISISLLVTSAVLGLMKLTTGILLNEGSALFIIANGIKLNRLKDTFHRKHEEEILVEKVSFDTGCECLKDNIENNLFPGADNCCEVSAKEHNTGSC